jgi:N-acetylmuramoyl-L-alanine amidase
MLTSSRPVAWTVRAVRGGLEVSSGGPLSADPAESKLDDPILSSWKVVDGKTLLLKTGTAYTSYETFELKNPSRLVLDLQGDRPKRGDASAAPSSARSIIVVDPGHGGVETGAIGPTGLQEKDVALDLARRLRTALEREAPVSVVLTRDEDRVVPLDERTAIANHNRAELFVSIHLNASKRKAAYGAETYFLSAEATDDEARTLAALESRAPEGAADSQAKPPENRGLDLILWDLAQNQYLAESSRLAESVQRELNAVVGTKDRGVRQAPFTVLMGATMPAMLIEVGFVSNPKEETRFRDEAYKDRVVEAIVRAILEFRRGRERADGKVEVGAGADGP